MAERILNIEEVENHHVLNHDGWSSLSMSGFKVTTDMQGIYLLIYDQQARCENWGYFLSEDNPAEFIGAELVDIKITDTALKPQRLMENGIGTNELAGIEPEVYDGDIMFVDLVTSLGVLQFVAYNAHNGYYGHEAKVVSMQLEHSEVL